MNEKWPLKNLMLSRKCRASEAVLFHSRTSSGGVSRLDRLIFPSRQQNPGGSLWNLFAPQCLQFGTSSNMCVSSGMLLYTLSYGSGVLELMVDTSSACSILTSSSFSSSEK